MTPNQTWTLNSQKYPIYTIHLPQRPKFWSVLALRPAVSKISYILQFPIDYHVKRPNKEQKKLPKIQSCFSNFGRDPPHQYAWFLGVNLMRTFRRCRLKFFLPYGPMLTKTKKKKIVENQKFKFWKTEKNGLEIWWIGPCHWNVMSIHLTVSDGWTTDAHAMTVALSSTKHS